MNKFICCPNCNYQYLPGEIFNPNYFLGQPKNIIRNNIGEILGYEGIQMDVNEHFICEHCATEFNVVAKINFCVQETDVPKTHEEVPEVHKLSLF